MKKVEENIIIVGDKSLNYDEFVSDIAELSIKNITDILLESQITLPRKLNVTALRLALNEKIVIAKTLNLSDEELFRLRFYPFFNEFQLQKLFTTLYDNELFTKYRKYLVELIIQNSEYLRVEDNLVNKILNIPNKFESFSEYQEILNKTSFDFDGYFDGVRFDDYDDNILKSLTSDDIRLLGSKYDINIPKRLKKEELISYVKEVMDLNGKSIPENVNLDSQSIMLVQRFAKKNNIKISADLKKDECLNYLFHQVNKKELDYKKEVLLNLYLGDSFVFDLSYVLKTEEKAPLPEVVMEEEVKDEPKPEVVPVAHSQIEVIEETPVEETTTKAVVEEVKEEQKEEVKQVETKVIVKEQALFDPKELVEIITKSVKSIVVDVVKEIAPLFKDEVKEEPKTPEEMIEQKVYNYDNFSNQTNPNYDEEIHHFIRNYDCKNINPDFEEIKIESNKFVITDLASENIDPEVVEKEDEVNLDNLTEEEKLALKKQKKEQKRQAKIDAKNLNKEEKAKRKQMSKEERALLAEEKKKQKEALKLEKKAKRDEEKAQAKQQKLEDKTRLKEERAQEKTNKKLEAEQAKIEAKEQKKENKLKLKEEKRVQKETDKKNRVQAKIDAKAKMKQDKIDAKERARALKEAEKQRQIKEEKNYNEIQKILNGKGDITKIDDDYFNKFMQLQNYKMNLAAYQDRESIKRNERKSSNLKMLFLVIFIALAGYVAFGMYLSYFYYVDGHPIYTQMMSNSYLRFLFEPFVKWFTQLVPQFRPKL